jgi:hypothetical protein
MSGRRTLCPATGHSEDPRLGPGLALSRGMARPLCFIRRDELLDITIRTHEGRALLRPTRAMTACVLSVLARCLALYRVDLHAFVFLSNHGHLMATVENALHATCFIRDFKRETTKGIRRLTGWKGKVWASGRPIPILDGDAAIYRVKYTLANGVKEGLVDHPLAWPGANSSRALLGDMQIAVPATRKAEDPALIRLTPIAPFRALSPEEHRGQIERLIGEVVDEARLARDGKPCLGLRRILDVDPFEPIALEKTRRPLAHATSIEAVLDFKAARAAHEEAFRRATGRLREAGRPVPFPHDSFPPSAGYEE